MYFFDILSIIAIVLLSGLLFFEFKRDIMMFQQNSYRPERYIKWLKNSGDSTTISRLIAIFIALFGLAGFGVTRFVLILFIVYSLIVVSILARKKYKKPLVATPRVLRLSCGIILIVSILVTGSVLASYYGILGKSYPIYAAAECLIFVFCFSHAVLIASSYLLSPIERCINKGFYNKAKKKLAEMPRLKIIGITGSYGKTSTKHYLYRILSEYTETLMTPGSYNTTLGVVRTINEHLKPYHEVFIVEMGAKQKGDIKEICELVQPCMGIITSVGPQHLETFKTIENVRDTKFELVDALPSDGYAFLNNDYEIIAQRKVDNCIALRYSCEKDSESEVQAVDIEYHSSGTKFKLVGSGYFNGLNERFDTQLLGKYNIANLAGAIACAIVVGVPIDIIKYAVSRIEPVEHRLSIRRLPSGVTILDDAFNSNPVGSSMAVEVLSSMKDGRRIIITPGMIELGNEQYNLNRVFGRKIAEFNIDYAVIIGHYNRDALTEGLKEGNYNEENIIYFDTFLDANAWMVAFARTGDIVLIENDLPDTFK